jgi:hypothetical protein
MNTDTTTDYPLSLAGAHGRIASYRAALTQAQAALRDAVPYIYGVQTDPTNAGWRRETAEVSLAAVDAALDRVAAELAVSNP